MKIILTANTAWNIWNFRRGLVKSLLAAGHDVLFFAPSDDAVKSLVAMGCSFVPMEMDLKGLSPLGGVSLMSQFLRAYKKHKPDIVLSFTIKNNIFGALVARHLRIPFIPNVTGMGTAFLSGGLLQNVAKFLYRRAFKSLDVVFFQNPDDLQFFLEHKLATPLQARKLPGSGINLEVFRPSLRGEDRPSAKTFLMISRLIKDKGVFEYVEAAKIVKAVHSDAQFLFLGGDGEGNRGAIDPENLKEWTDAELIHYSGFVADVREKIALADCIVLPSYREGAPRTLIEAAAMGKPLITTDVPGCRSIVDDGQNGFLCEVRSGESLAQACMKFLDLSVQEKSQMGAASRLKMQREFDEEIVTSAYVEALKPYS